MRHRHLSATDGRAAESLWGERTSRPCTRIRDIAIANVRVSFEYDVNCIATANDLSLKSSKINVAY